MRVIVITCFLPIMFLHFLQSQEIIVQKIRNEDCKTKCSSGLISEVDEFVLKATVTLPTDLINNTAIFFENILKSSTTLNHMFSVDIRYDCVEIRSNKSNYHCAKISDNKYTITITSTAESALSEATVRGEIRHHNSTTLAFSEQILPIICEPIDALAILTINGENVTALNNCTMSIPEGDDLHLEFDCFGPAVPCVIEITSSVWNEQHVGENKLIIKRHLYKDANIYIKHALCGYDKEFIGNECTLIKVSTKNQKEAFIIILITGIPTAVVALFAIYSVIKIISIHKNEAKDIEKHPDERERLNSKDETNHEISDIKARDEIGETLLTIKPEEESEQRDFNALINACLHGEIHTVEDLINRGTNINAKDSNGLTPLTHAIKAKNTKIADLLIKHGGDLKDKMQNGMTYLMLAAEGGITETTETLIDNQADVNETSTTGSTALMIASLHGHADIVQMLIDKGANTKCKNKDGFNALIIASTAGHTRIVKMILDTWTVHNHVNSKKEKSTSSLINSVNNFGQTALMCASMNGHSETVILLLQHNAEVSLKNNEGFTCLMLASAKGKSETVQTLIKFKAKVNEENNDGFTPLMLAAQDGHCETVKELIRNGAEVNAKNKLNRTALMIAASNGYSEVVQYLCKHGTNVNAKDSDKMTALMYSLKNNKNCDTSKLLLKRGANVKKGDKKGLTCLMLASINDQTDMVEKIIKRGANVNDRTELGRNALMHACELGHIATAEMLIEHGSKVNEKDVSGVNALMLASRHGHVEICKLLIRNGALVGDVDNEGKTALNHAKDNHHTDIVDVLTSLEDTRKKGNIDKNKRNRKTKS